MTKNEFINKLKDNGLLISDKQMNQLDTYAAFLKEYNEKINLTGITEYEEVLDKHFYDSLLISFNKDLKGKLCDVGTGAGFPGVVLAICFPELAVTLIEPLKKRCVFLEELINKLELSNVELINDRGEDYSIKHRGEFDFVTARAVSNMNVLIEVCGALVKKNGYFIAMRGETGQEDIAGASKAIETMGFTIENIKEDYLFNGNKRVIGYLFKEKDTPMLYPRKYSIIKSRSL